MFRRLSINRQTPRGAPKERSYFDCFSPPNRKQLTFPEISLVLSKRALTYKIFEKIQAISLH